MNSDQKTAFICTTPFHVMGALSIVEKYSFDADIFICNKFSQSEQCYKVLSNTKFFDHVFFVDESLYENRYKVFKRKGKFKNRVNIFYRWLKADKILKFLNIDITRYKNLMFASEDNTPIIFFISKLRNNKTQPFEFSFFDDGIGFYFDRNISQLSSFAYFLRFLASGFRSGNRNPQNIYLYQPELFQYLNPDVKVDLRKMSFIKNDKQNIELLKNMFLSNNESLQLMKHRIVFFDSIRTSELTRAGIKILNEILKEIEISYQDFFIKRHPRDKITNGLKFGDVRDPLEIFCYMIDFEKSIFITNISSAVFTPKLLFDKEPTVIFLYKILYAELIRPYKSKIDLLTNSFRKLYNNPNKVFVPNTKEELFNYIDQIS